MSTIKIPEVVRTEIKRQADLRPMVILSEDRAEFMAKIEPQDQTAVDDHLNHLLEQDERNKWEFLEGAVVKITRLLSEVDLGRFQKPLLTIEEASSLLSLSRKRFENIICQERARLGRSPDFIVDAGGRMSRRVLRDELIAWARRRGKNDRRRMVA
jgi:hypothetical protein